MVKDDQLQGTRGVMNVSSRTWDASVYQEKALHREDQGSQAVRKSEFLEARKTEVRFDDSVGKVKSIDIEAQGGRVGFFCKECQLTFPDSDSYLVHLNSSKHQARLGQSMNVERSSIEAVKDAMTTKIESKHSHSIVEETPLSFEERVKALEDAEEQKKIDRLYLKAKRKEEKQLEVQEEFDDQEAMEMMGFGSFGSKKKK